MKNIFKLGSVFMALALVISTLLFTGVFASAEPDWQLIYDGSFSGDADFSGYLAPIPGDDWNNAMAAEIATYGISEKYRIVSDATFDGDGYACWGIYEPVSEAQWWGDAFDGATYPYDIDIASTNLSIDDSYIFGMVGEGVCTVSASIFQVYAYREAGSTETTATAAATEAEPTATEAEPTATEATTYVPIRSWSDTNGMDEIEFNGEGHTSSIYLRKAVVGTAGTWGEFTAAMGSIDEDQYIEVVYTGTFTGVAADTTYFKSRVWQETVNKTYAVVSASDSEIVIRVNGPLTYAEPTDPNFSTSLKVSELSDRANTHFTLTVYGKGEPTATGAEPTATGAEPTATGAEPTATEVEPTATEVEPTATGAEPTEPVSLVETVLVENNVGGAKVLKPEKTDAWFLQVDEIKADIAANGPIDPSKGEYYQIVVTGYVDNGEADFHLGEGLDWNEYWGKSGSITTEPSTVVATIPVAIPAEGIGAVYLADSGEAGHTLTWTYAKVSVFRVGEPTEPIVTESEPQSTETEPAATETTPGVAIYGDANGDGVVNLKDVLAARKYVAGIETEIDLVTSDVNQDGAVNMKDILLIRKFIAGLITSFDA